MVKNRFRNRYTAQMAIDRDFYCTQCGRKGIPICRIGNMRKAGHLKILFCFHCGREVNHVECISGSRYDRETFLREWETGNFDTDGKRIKPLMEWEKDNKR